MFEPLEVCESDLDERANIGLDTCLTSEFKRVLIALAYAHE